MKKLLLGLGTLAAVATPVAAVVACGSNEDTFGKPSSAQETALDNLAAQISAKDDVNEPTTNGLTEKEVLVKGDSVQITYTAPAAPDSSDSTTVATTVAVRYTVDLKAEKLISIETKLDGAEFIASDDTAVTALSAKVESDIKQANTDIEAEEAIQHPKAPAAGAAVSQDTFSTTKTKAQLKAQVASGIITVEDTQTKLGIEILKTIPDTKITALEWDPTKQTLKVSVDYSGMATTTTIWTVKGTDETTSTGTVDTTTPGTGTGTPAAKAVANAFDDSTKTVSVTIDVEADDFQNHIAGEAALAIQTVMVGKDIADIEHVTITINDGTTTETNTADVATQTATSTDADIIVKQKLNGAINDAAEQDAEADLGGHDMALKSQDYAKTMVARIKAVDATTADFNFANEILKAIGNATRFTSATEIQAVFGAPYAFSLPSVKEEIENMLKLGSFGTFDSAIETELTKQFAKITD